MSINDFKRCIKLMKYNGDGVTFRGFVIWTVFVQLVLLRTTFYISSGYSPDNVLIMVTFLVVIMMNFGFSLWKTCRLTAGSELNKEIFCRKVPFITGVFIVLTFSVLVVPAVVKSLINGADCTADALAALMISAFAVFLYCLAEGFFGMKLIRVFFPAVFYILLFVTASTGASDAAVKAASAFSGNIYINAAVIVLLAVSGPFMVSVLRRKFYTGYISSGFVLKTSWNVGRQ